MKNTIKLLLFQLLLFCAVSVNAQDSPKQEALYLIDGSVLNGVILEQTEDFTKIKIISGDVLLLNNDLISKKGIKKTFKPRRSSALHEKGVYNIISTGLLLGRDAELVDGLQTGFSALHYVRGYQFNKFVGLGVGAGLDLYDVGFVPIYADFRGNFNVKKITFFYSLQGGYAITNDDFGGEGVVEKKGGVMVCPSFGIKFPSKSKTDITLGLGYKNQWSKKEHSFRENPDEIIYRRYSLQFGFAF